MMKFKLSPYVAYSDTDSVFTTDLTEFEGLLSKELGDFKDELNGLTINEAAFLGIKQYGYWYIDKKGNKIVKSVFAGVKRNSFTFEQVLNLKDGANIVVRNNDRFFKSLTKFTVEIKPSITTVKQNIHKKLVNNLYIPKKYLLLTQH